MVDHKRIMSLLVQGVSYSDIAAQCRCSRRTISKINRVVKDHEFTLDQITTLGRDELAGLFPDQRVVVLSDADPRPSFRSLDFWSDW